MEGNPLISKLRTIITEYLITEISISGAGLELMFLVDKRLWTLCALFIVSDVKGMGWWGIGFRYALNYLKVPHINEFYSIFFLFVKFVNFNVR
jgi:hypothetical protein